MELHRKLYRLRNACHLSQEKLAEALNVSRQAVQKWESGQGIPDLDNVIRIAKYFHVTIDSLLLDSNQRMWEEMTMDKLIQPNYSIMEEWEYYAANALTEYRQCMEEGKDIAAYEALFRAVQDMPASSYKARMGDVLFDLINSLPQREDYPYDEPSTLEAIRALRPVQTFQPRKADEKLRDRILGAWQGRVVGCMLGKPVEGIKTEELHPILKESGNWPMHRYILWSDITPEMCQRTRFRLESKCYADTVDCAQTDDDTNYTVLYQTLIERFGRDFTPLNAIDQWLSSQRKRAYCTAERVAFCNRVRGYCPPDTALWQNPYREWIGAQIRGDYFGYINPGDPEAAADMAWRDASISHVKNGIYGEMFAAAMIAAATVEDDIEAIILAGLDQIPATSRLYEAIMKILSSWKSGMSQDDCFAMIHQDWDEHNGHDWCHTISNAMIVAASLLYGEGDFGRSICMAVQTGFDTDCNGATVGSILGIRGGTAAIAPEWLAPFNDTLDTALFLVGKARISEVAEKTMEHMPK